MESEVGVFRTLVSDKSTRPFPWRHYPLPRLVTDGGQFVSLLGHADYDIGLLGLIDDAGWDHLDQARFIDPDRTTDICVAPRNWAIIS